MARIKPTLAALATAGIVAATVVKARTWNLTWGATPAELLATLPGDAIVPAANVVATRAVTIEAEPEQIWPWLVQLGQGRAGFYSYDALENAIGLDIHSADRIVPDFQSLAVGDPVHLAPDVALEVAVLEPNVALVLRGAEGLIGQAPPFAFSWAFTLAPAAEAGTTRFVVRERYGYESGWAPFMVEPVQWVSFLMTHKMLRGIKARAERVTR